MILPIVAYGDPILRKETEEIDADYPDLQALIENMYETMHQASGVGLAAPQIGKNIRLFVVDTSGFADESDDDDPKHKEEMEQLKEFRQVFINPIILEEDGREWSFNEGCLSIPKITEDINRKANIRIEYYDRDFQLKEEDYTGLIARVIQHEYDHLEGVLFTDHLNPLKRRLLKKRLTEISRGDIKVDYKMRFPLRKKK